MCPPELLADEAPRGEASAGWQVAQHVRVSGRRLEGVELYSGHPDQMAALVPDSSVRTGQRRSSTWRFTESGGPGPWLACTYSNSLLQFVRPLPPGTRQCVLSQNLNRLGGVVAIEFIDCR